MPMPAADHPVLLFDGVCNLCNGFVQFVITHDPKARFRFAALQSEAGQALLQQCGRAPGSLDSVVLVENGRCYTRSTAALRVARQLSGGWPLLYSFMVVPPVLRNAVYDFVARNRYRWFGQQESCMLPTPELKARFL